MAFSHLNKYIKVRYSSQSTLIYSVHVYTDSAAIIAFSHLNKYIQVIDLSSQSTLIHSVHVYTDSAATIKFSHQST